MAAPQGNLGTDPANDWLAITPGTPFALCRAIFVGGAGTVVTTSQNGNTATFTSAGGVIPIQTTNVSNTSTATGLVALY